MADNFVYEKDVSDNKDLELSIRQSINSWANSIPNHPFTNLGDTIDIKSIWYKPSYPIRLRSQYEERSKFKDHEPFKGQNIPPRKYYELSDFNSWDISLKKVNEFENSTSKYYVDGSQYVTNCHRCNASGSVICHRCSGNRIITCPGCSGSGKVNCSSCGGSGTKSCSSCGGSGSKSEQVSRTRQVQRSNGVETWMETETYYETVSRSCSSCGGSGRNRCYTCSGSGKITCPRCSGRRSITCPVCSGTGSLVCPVCMGKTKLMHHFYVKRDLEFTDKGTCIIHDDIYDDFPEYLKNFSGYESEIVFSTKNKSLEKGQLPAQNHLNKFIDKYIEEAEDENTNSHCKLFQKLDVSCIDTWLVTYTLKGKDYNMVITGNQLHVIPGLSPIYEVAHGLWEKGISSARNYMYSRSSRLLTKSLSIDVFEIRDNIKLALNTVNGKINDSYRLGSYITLLLIAFFGGFLIYTYYSEVNYVFDYVDFINDPDNFLYPIHAWAQTFLSVYLIYLAYLSSKACLKPVGNKIPLVLLRISAGILCTLLFAVFYILIWALLNATGFSLIVTLAAWFAVKLILIIWWLIKIILGLVIFVVQIVWGILKWIWGLFF